MKKLLLFIFIICIKLVNAQIIITVAGDTTQGSIGDGGQATNAELTWPQGLTIDKHGNLYIADYGSGTVRKVNSSGVITTVVGNGIKNYSGDGGSATMAELQTPAAVAFDTIGNMFIPDSYSHCVRKVNTNGIITTFAGKTSGGNSGDGGFATSAQLEYPNGVTFDKAGNVYIIDWSAHNVRKVNSLGIITTVVGNGTPGYTGDGGPATNAQLHFPEGLGFDSFGNLYVADSYNNCVRKVDTLGIISTVVGNGTVGYNGDGGMAISAQLNTPYNVIFDILGNMYIADYNNNRIRVVNTTGIINTIVGNGTRGYAGDGGQAVSAELNAPTCVVFSGAGNMYIADMGNKCVRMITNGTNSITEFSRKNTIVIYPNPTQNNFTIETTNNEKQTLNLYDVNGKLVLSQTINGTTTINASTLAQGIYNLSITSNESITNKRLVIVH